MNVKIASQLHAKMWKNKTRLLWIIHMREHTKNVHIRMGFHSFEYMQHTKENSWNEKEAVILLKRSQKILRMLVYIHHAMRTNYDDKISQIEIN
jgi:hypothetical protein